MDTVGTENDVQATRISTLERTISVLVCILIGLVSLWALNWLMLIPFILGIVFFLGIIVIIFGD